MDITPPHNHHHNPTPVYFMCTLSSHADGCLQHNGVLGARPQVRSTRHFEAWLYDDDSGIDVKNGRHSPENGDHYTTHVRTRPTHPDRSIKTLSEGNRFIRDQDL